MLFHLIGYMAIVASCLTMAMKNDRHLRMMNLTGIVLWGSYYALGGHVEAALTLCLAFGIVASSMLGYKRMRNVLIACNLASIPLIIFLRGPLESLSAIGSATINIGVSCFSGHAMTAIMFGGGLIWLAYSFSQGAYEAAINSTISAIAVIIRTTLRLRDEKRASISASAL